MGFTSTIGDGLSVGDWTGGFTGISVYGMYVPRTGSGGGGTALPASQQQFPTSAYGQTIPVIWGKARVPGGYIWAPDIIVKTTTTGAVLQTTTVKVLLSARIRFAAPLVPDSRWKLRRLWQDGTLIVDNTRGYKKSGFTYRFYDGHSSQGRDPHMVSKEGAAANVSAHRGYLDIVIQNYDLGVSAVAPPSFEAELVQDETSSVDVEETTGFFSDRVGTFAAADWENGIWYGVTNSPDYLRLFDISTNQEIYAIPYSGVTGFVEDVSLRYIPEMNRIIGVGYDSSPGVGGAFPFVMDPETGAVIASAAAMGIAGEFTSNVCPVVFGPNAGVLVGNTYGADKVSTYRFSPTSMERVTRSGNDWDGLIGAIRSIIAGDIRASDADVYVLGSDTVYKTRVASSGLLTNITALYTDPDTLVYGLYYDGGLIVWNDTAEVMRVNVTSGAVEWTESVPYQINDDALLRTVAPGEMNRLDGGVIMVLETNAYNFTNLDTGETTSVSKSVESVQRHVYDSTGDLAIGTDRGFELARVMLFDVVGDGTTRDLEDFLVDLMVAGGFDASEIDVEGVDDQIQGAVIDITGGVRDVARSVCEPYSIAIFERAGKIIFKRAETDGSFVVDATIGSSDIIDQGGQAIQIKRLNPEEIPSRYGINYRDADEVYQARPQYGSIPSLPLPVAPNDMGVRADIGIISDGDTMKALATQKVYRIAVQKHEFGFEARAEHLKIEPETICQFNTGNRTITARVIEQTIKPDFTNRIIATEFLSSTAVSISGATGRPVEPEEAGTALSKYYHLDIPLLADTHDTEGGSLVQYHVLASAGQLNWGGATLFRKDSNTYLPQASQVTDGLVLIALEALPDVDIPYVTEFTRTLEVARFSGDADLLESITYQAMCEGGNMFAIGQPGRWEICHVQTITDNGDNTYTFETLRRGMGSSEEYTGDHEIGDLIVWLGEENVQRLEYAIDALNDAFDFKPVGFVGSLETTIAVNRTITGEAEKIPKPANLKAVIDGSDIDLSWIRRTRVGSYWADNGEDTYTPPLGESLEQYVIRIKDGPGGTVLREVTVNNATAYTYTAANITTDFGSMPSELTYDIRQVSGTGVVCPTREATITL